MTVHGVNVLYLAAALPALVFIGIWATSQLQRFVLSAVLPAMIVPAALAQPGGAQIALADLLLLVALALWLILGSVGRAPPMRIKGNRILVPALLFVAVSADSIAWSVQPGATVKFTIQLLELIVVFPIVFASLPQSTGVIRRGFLAYIGVSSILAVIAVAVYAPHAAAGELQGQSLALGLQKNTVGSVVGAGLVLAYALWVAAPRGQSRWLGGAAMIEALGLISTVSRAAIIGALLACLVVSLLMRRSRALTFALVATVAVGYLLTLGTTSHARTNLPGAYDSSEVRSYAWADAVKKIEHDPLLGSGGATYTDNLQPIHVIVGDPNNMFLLTWAELGIGGILALCFLLARFGGLLLSSRRLPGEFGVLAIAAGGVSLSLLIHVQFDETWTRGTSSLAFAMIGLMLALRRLARAPARAPAAVAADASRSYAPARVRPEIA